LEAHVDLETDCSVARMARMYLKLKRKNNKGTKTGLSHERTAEHKNGEHESIIGVVRSKHPKKGC
jgi:hypothetical protein